MTAPKPTNARNGVCDRCGREDAVYRKLLIHDIDWAAMDGPYEWHCDRCRKILRVYSAIGLTILGLTLAAVIAAIV